MPVVVLPDRDEERAGVIRTMFMNEALIHRPTSGASAEELAAQLRDARSCTRRLSDDLTAQQLMGPMLPIVNPILWEIGHVGWFHEYWTLRTGKHRLSSAPTACGIQARSPMRRDGIWTCPIARACSNTWRMCLAARPTAFAAGSSSPPAISTSFR